MKITNNQLKQIIKEELSAVLNEQEDPAKNERLMDFVFTYYDAEDEGKKEGLDAIEWLSTFTHEVLRAKVAMLEQDIKVAEEEVNKYDGDWDREVMPIEWLKSTIERITGDI